VGTMTDGARTAAGTPTLPTRPRPPASTDAPRGGKSSPRARRGHPLLGAFPLAVMTLAVFLVLFTLMMARLKAGADPVLSASTSISLVSGSPGGGAVTTRASGATPSGGGATPVAGAEGSRVAPAVIVTRSSGAAGAREAGDE
jgi:hypothetical protein